MEKTECEERIRELEDQVRLMKERYQILVETTSALLFEYQPDKDRMIFNYNFPDNKTRNVIENYHKYVEVSPLVHPNHLKKFMDALDEASLIPVRGEIEYLSKVSSGEYQWHKTYYSSIASKEGKVLSVLGRIHNIHESAKEMEDMIHRVETDFLTGLYNKKAATDKITKWLKDNPTKEAELIMLDLDDFKRINDVYGHAFGDEILKEAARIMEECFSEEDILSRFGGDEFVIFVKDKPPRSAECMLDRLMQKLVKEVNNLGQSLRCSAGISVRESRYDDYEDLFNRADNAMYMAKKAGKNCYHVDRR